MLVLNNNSISGTLPDSWAEADALPKLRYLDLSSSQIKGSIPSSWVSSTAFSNLQVLDLSNSNLQGPLPAFDNTNLGVLNLHHCAFNSDLSALWNSTAPLVTASLAHNTLKGFLPQAKGSLPKLAFLSLGGNQLEGTVPLDWMQASLTCILLATLLTQCMGHALCTMQHKAVLCTSCWWLNVVGFLQMLMSLLQCASIGGLRYNGRSLGS